MSCSVSSCRAAWLKDWSILNFFGKQIKDQKIKRYYQFTTSYLLSLENAYNLNGPVIEVISIAKLLLPAVDKKDCGEVKNLVSHFQSLQVICLSAVKTCGLEILSGAANLNSCVSQTLKPLMFIYLHMMKKTCPKIHVLQICSACISLAGEMNSWQAILFTGLEFKKVTSLFL